MLTNATIVRSKALECAYDAQKTHITQTCPDTLHGRVGMHTRCTNSAQVMHVKCALNARRSGSLRPLLLVLLLVLTPPRRGVCSIAAILEDPEEVVDVVLLLVGGQPRLLQLHLLEVELLVVRVVRRGVLEREAPREGRRCVTLRATRT